ncbi:hypothetical protein [Lacticaseibacillus jixiensis]|uniref:hypothetical protein n=1 Tax=Lacticaseibacillus jixiensis TaxID=3231926 RepID=UPI0036F1E309
MQADQEFRQKVFNNYRVAMNVSLEILGYDWVQFPWQIIAQLHSDWETTKSKSRKQQLAIVISAMREWRQWLSTLGNTVIPDYCDEDMWYTD